MRKKAHTDSGLLTLLASEDWLDASGWRPWDGGLQLMNAEGRWVEVAVPQGALLLNLGSLLTRVTNGRWQSTLHRVTNPQPRQQQPQQQQPQQQPQQQQERAPTRRLSVALFHKPDYTAVIDAAPTCLADGAPRRYNPAVAADLTRAGVLHKLARLELPPEEASRRYHQEMAETRRQAAGGSS